MGAHAAAMVAATKEFDPEPCPPRPRRPAREEDDDDDNDNEPKKARRLSAPIASSSIVFVVICLFLFANLRASLSFRENVPLHADLPRATVDLGYARYSGTLLTSGVKQFLGMRYAAPPTGNLRWRAPRDPEPETGTTDATRLPPTCLSTDAGYPVPGQDEDCLYVNVWSPNNATTSSKLPVWLMIQGGGYSTNSNPNWNGSQVVEVSGRNIVFVSFNYRVGIWGFLASERIREDGELNVGLLDQRLAMKWVQTHITKFGGDPNHVVIHGLSAGAGSVALHLAAYGGRDDKLFTAAMSESLFFPTQPRVAELEYQFDRAARGAGCGGDGEDQMACLRDKDVSLIQSANVASPYPGRSGNPRFYFTPCVDGDFLRDYPYRVYEKGAFVKVPVIFGTGTNEGSVFAANAATADEFLAFLTDNYPHLTKNETDAVLARYPLTAPLPRHNAWFPSASLAYGETTFVCPTNVLMDAFAAANRSAAAWSYRFNVQDAGNTAAGIGVPHIFEAPAIFGIDACPTPDSYRTYNRPIVPLVMNYWISFIRDLDPNTHRLDGAPVWDAWGTNRSRYVFELGMNRMEDVDPGQTSRCNFWKSIAGIMEQ